ncbi:DUF968 domain-containing protein [Agrobacterium sp. Ap1]|uniref:DUF968 domain-containing protein n=1 Tax=Agrobacterium sp. Ap1 TaxID=2815337 RepID=UPI001A8F31AC|nr:DUF968 domain-containing protein [Agrobacterium sp. Ap1]MBO0141455.1 DUF968 domain-containing protein [Agrobacterium sp. Ap1]
MASRIAYIPREEPPKRRPAKRGNYLAWLHSLPCVVTGRNDVQAAHVSFAAPWHGHYGRARGTKAPDRFALPVCASEHARQHNMSESAFWDSVGINPHELANTLFGIWSDYDEQEATSRATSRILSGLADAGRLPSRDLA